MRLMCKSVDKNNIDEILNLKVAKGQENQIESVEDCLKEAGDVPCWRPVGIYDEDILIGFAMYGFWETEGNNGRLWFDRFFIDERFQGKGYARAVLKLIINVLEDEYKPEGIFLSVTDEMIPAVKLYRELGFEFNGEVDIKGEKIMYRKIK